MRECIGAAFGLAEKVEQSVFRRRSRLAVSLSPWWPVRHYRPLADFLQRGDNDGAVVTMTFVANQILTLDNAVTLRIIRLGCPRADSAAPVDAFFAEAGRGGGSREVTERASGLLGVTRAVTPLRWHTDKLNNTMT